MESCVRGYHIYKDIWEASVGEELPCQRESGNRAGPFAVAVVVGGKFRDSRDSHENNEN